ncbi:MAG: WD40 repeat domain-containing protein, partial [Planctomycetales bacterium]
PDAVNALAFSPDGKELAFASVGGLLRRGNLKTGIETEGGSWAGVVHSQKIYFLDGAFQLPKRRTWKLSAHAIPEKDPPRVIVHLRDFPGDLNPTKKLLVETKGGFIRLVDLSQPEGRVSPGTHFGGATRAEFSPDGSKIITMGNDQQIGLWNAESGAHVKRIAGDYFRHYSTAVFVDNDRILFGGWTTELTNLRTKETKYLDWFPVHLRCVAVSRSGMIAIGGPAGRVTIVRLDDDSRKPFWVHNGEIQSIAFSPDGKRLLTATRDSVKILDAAKRSAVATLPKIPGEIRQAVYSPDGERIAACASRGTIHIWNAKTTKPIRDLRVADNQAWSVAYSPDGTLLISGHATGGFRVWDPKSGKRLATLDGEQGAVR